MKKLLLFSAIAVASCYARGADFGTLTLVCADGTEHVLPAVGLQFSVDGGVLTATSSDGTSSIPLASLSRMYFGDQSGLEAIPATIAGPVTIFKADGTCAGTFPAADAARAALQPGLYVAVADGKIYKIAVQ